MGNQLVYYRVHAEVPAVGFLRTEEFKCNKPIVSRRKAFKQVQLYLEATLETNKIIMPLLGLKPEENTAYHYIVTIVVNGNEMVIYNTKNTKEELKEMWAVECRLYQILGLNTAGQPLEIDNATNPDYRYILRDSEALFNSLHFS